MLFDIGFKVMVTVLSFWHLYVMHSHVLRQMSPEKVSTNFKEQKSNGLDNIHFHKLAV